MFALGNRVSNPWRKGAIFFTTKILASSPCPKIIGLESKITGKGSISIRRRISSQVNLAKLRYEFSMKFLQTFLFRSLNVEGYRAFLSRNFSCGTCISPRSCAFFFLGRNWIVVTDSDQKSKNFISDTHTFRHLSRTIIEKSCLATDERERTKISIEEDFYARNLDKGKIRSRVGNKMLERKLRRRNREMDTFLPRSFFQNTVERDTLKSFWPQIRMIEIFEM